MRPGWIGVACAFAAAATVYFGDEKVAAPAPDVIRPEAEPARGTVRHQAAQQVTPGITVLLQDSLHLIRGRRVGLITNHTGRDATGRSSIDLIHAAPGVRLTALFAPEHGIRGQAAAGARIASTRDSATGVPIHSLYGERLVPTARMLADVDVIIYDIQDVGARMYTYVWTMTLSAEAAKKARKRFIVLDRPNPIRADIVQGGLMEREYRSFTGLHNVPLRYGLTVGELARYLVGTGRIDAGITVVPMKGYRRSMWWEDTGLTWTNPSPNIRSVDAAVLYPGTVFFEATNLSVGRGTAAPFQLIGARWLTDAPAIADALNRKWLPGVRFEHVHERIERGFPHSGSRVPMIRVVVTDRNKVRAADVGAHMLREIVRRHPQFEWREQGIERLSGSRALRVAVQQGGIEALLQRWERQSARFAAGARRYHLYP